jgi:hypothetical protein
MYELLTIFDGISLWVNLYLNWGASAAFILNIVFGNLGLRIAEDGGIVMASLNGGL